MNIQNNDYFALRANPGNIYRNRKRIIKNNHHRIMNESIDFDDNDDNDNVFNNNDAIDAAADEYLDKCRVIMRIYEEIYNAELLLSWIKIVLKHECVRPVSREELDIIIRLSYLIYGNKFDLNWVDVSHVDDMSQLFNPEKYVRHDTGFSHGFGQPTVKRYIQEFQDFDFNGNIEHWDVSHVKNMSCMFQGCASFNGSLAEWNVSKARDMSSMFEGAVSFNGNIENWNIRRCRNCSRMFMGASSFNCNIGEWNTSSVENATEMFMGATSFNQNIRKWQVYNFEYVDRMFKNASSFKSSLAKWDLSDVDTYDEMFTGCPLDKKRSLWPMLPELIKLVNKE